MDKSTLNKFQTLFEQERARLLYSSRIISDAFEIQKEDLPDEADWSASELEQAMKTRLRSRETSFLKKIDSALDRIREGTFGMCESCEETIDVKRLEARPTATFCIRCKETQERHEWNFGKRIRFA